MKPPDLAALWLPTPSDSDRYLGPYRVIRKLGAGGMGIVYLGVDPTDKPVAIKVLREAIAEDFDARSRLAREVQTLRKVRHRCVAAVIDADLEAQSPYLVTEYVQGPQLDHYIDQVGPLSRAGLVNLGRGLIGALQAIHEVDVVHRDLKPGNVLLRRDTPVVIDFGIAQAADDIRLTVTGLFIGTPGYVAPEVIDGVRSSTATDWWGWAATLAFAATGRPPAGRGPFEVVLDRIRRGRLDLEGVDPDLVPLLEQLLSPDPTQRPPVERIVESFGRYADGGSTATAPPRPAGFSRARPQAEAPVQQPTTRAERWIEKARAHAETRAARNATSVLPQPAPLAAAPAEPRRESLLPPALSPRRDQPAPAPPRTGPVDPRGDGQPQPGVDPRTPAGPTDSLVADAPAHRRRGTLAALGFFVVVLGAGWPVLAVIAIVLWVLVARFCDRVSAALAQQRQQRGPKRSDLFRQTALSPWHLLIAAATSLLGLVLPLLVGVAVAYGGFKILQRLDFTTDFGEPGMNLILMAGFAATVVTLWWGPGSASVRRSSARLVGVIAPDRFGSRVAIGLAVLSTLVLAALVLAFPAVTWWPLDGVSIPDELRLF